MGRAIYALKMWLFFDQYQKLQPRRSSSRDRIGSSTLKSGLTEFCLFLAEHYVRPWFTAMNPQVAPRTDLEMLKNLAEHENQLVKDAGIRTLSRHLWYISEVTVGLSLFDDSIPTETKRKMVRNIQTVEGRASPEPRSNKNAEYFLRKELPDFFTKSTIRLLRSLAIDSSFLEIDPDFWNENDAFQQGKYKVKNLKVTNDAAERGVALITEFTNNGRTKNDEQLKAMVEVVEDHRKRFPTANKSVLIA